MKRTIRLILNLLLCTQMNACATDTEEPQPVPATTAQKQNNMSDLSFHIASTQAVYTAGTPITLAVNLNNHTSQSMAILPWGTPLETRFNNDMFEISQDGVAIPYHGRMVKRGQPRDSDYIQITPKKSLSAAIDLSQAYTIQTPGQYTINMKPRFLSIRNKDAENKDAENKLQKVESNSIVIEVTE